MEVCTRHPATAPTPAHTAVTAGPVSTGGSSAAKPTASPAGARTVHVVSTTTTDPAPTDTTTPPEADPELLAEVESLRQRVAVDPATSFRAAYDELQELVAQLESDRADVDELAEKVARATALAEHCRRKVTTTRAVFQVLDPTRGG